MSETEGLESRSGPYLLVALFFAMLAGRFDIGRVFPVLSGIDMRWLIAGVMVLAFLAWAGPTDRRRQYVAPAWEMLLLGAWVFWMSLSGLWAVPESDVMAEVENLLLLLIFVELTRAVASRVPEATATLLFKVTIWTAYVYLIAGLASGPSAIGRLAAFGGGPNVFARVMVLGTMGALALVVHNSNLGYLVLMVPLLGGAALSGSRGATLSVILVVLIAVPIIFRRVGTLRGVVGACAFVLLGFRIWRVIPEEPASYLYRRYIVQTLGEHYSSGRDGLWTYAADLFSAHMITGAGIGTFAATYRPGVEGFYAHNLLFSTGAEGGIIGLLILVCALVLPVHRILKARPLSPNLIFLLLCALAIFVASMFSGDYYDTRFMWFYLVLAEVWSAPRARSNELVRNSYL